MDKKFMRARREVGRAGGEVVERGMSKRSHDRKRGGRKAGEDGIRIW